MSYPKYAKTAGSFVIGFSTVGPVVWLSARAAVAAKHYGLTESSREEGYLQGAWTMGLIWLPALMLSPMKFFSTGAWSAGVLSFTALYFFCAKPANREISN